MVVIFVFAARHHRAAWFVLAFVALAMPAGGQSYQGKQLVQAELIAKTTAIVAGQPFQVGLLLKMAPGWHTYWKFPGDAGIPTELKWNLPEGWRVGEIRWPLPLKLEEPGDIRIYGYHDEVLLMQEITPPASVSATSVKMSAEANWLVCEKICIPGGAKVELDLPVAANAAPANEEVFRRFETALPQPLPEEMANALSWSRTANELILAVKNAELAKRETVEFFPVPGESLVVGHVSTERQPDGVLFHIPLDTPETKEGSIPGVIAFGDGGWAVNATTLAAPATAPVTEAPIGKWRQLLTFLFFGFIGGFILNLMPCVLPVISLKIFGFIQQAGKSRAKIFRSGVAFSAGIFAWFLGLALVIIALKAAGHQVAWALQFTNPYFVVGMSALVLVFALNLFGVFELTLPGGASTGLLAWASREGDAGSFLHGMFATVLATPCTAPFLGAALGFAFTQSAVVIVLMFLAVAAGMSLPYLALALQPGWLRVVPKPGPWMMHVKHFMGFLMLATLLFLLAVLGAQRGVDGIVWTSAFLLILGIAAWLKGAFVTPLASTRVRVIVLLLIVLLVGGSARYFIGEKFAATKAGTAPALADGWIPFTPATLEAELAKGGPVFIDFTAAWCITCKFNESTVLESAAVREAFALRRIVKIKADWTNADPAITKMLQGFGRPGVPLYVLYPAGKSVPPIVFPELLTQGLVLEKLETVAPQVAYH